MEATDFATYAQSKPTPKTPTLSEMLALMHQRPGKTKEGTMPAEFRNCLTPKEVMDLKAKARAVPHPTKKPEPVKPAVISSKNIGYYKPKYWPKDKREDLKQWRKESGVFGSATVLHKSGGGNSYKRA